MKNINFLTRWGGKDTSNSWKRVTQLSLTLVTLLIFTCAHVWGADFTPQQIIDGASSGNISVSSAIATSTSSQKVCNTEVTTVSIDGTANGDGNAKYIQIQAASGYTISSLSIDASINKTDGKTYKVGIAFFSGTYSSTVTSKAELVVACKNATSGCGPYNISVPSGTRTVRIYRGVKINGSNAFDGSGTLYGSGQNTYVAGISATAAAAGTDWYIKGGWNSWGTTDNFTGSGTTISRTVNIITAGLYEFKIWEDSGGDGTWYGNTGNIGCNVSGWTFSSGESSNCKFFASETGNYTFTFNTSTKALSVTYPTAQGKYYYKNTGSWAGVYVYRYVGGINNGWAGTQVVETETVCGDTYYFTYADPGTTLIFTCGSNSCQTGNLSASGNAGKYASGTGNSWTAFPTYTVTYNKNGDGAGGAGSVTGNVPTDGSSPYACGSTVTVLGNTGSLALDGYTFAGWNTAANGSGASYAADATFSISANTTLYAQWEEIRYTVTYNVNGGGSVTPTSATQASEGASLTLPTPIWSGYTFEGWYNGGTKIGNAGASYTPTADITLYAHWTDNISGKVFSFIDNNYGDKFKAFDLSGYVTGNGSNKDKTYTNGTTGVQFVIADGYWDNKSNAISALAKFKGGTSAMSIVIPTGKIATVKISYNAYGTGDDYRLTVNGSAQSNPSTKLDDGNTNAQVISNMKEITLNNQTGTLTLGISNTGKNNYIGRVSAVITGYTVSYAAGTYGSGSLASGTKTHGSNFTLSSADDAFTRDGYVYDGWSVNADGSTKDYNLGGTYSTDAAITLYPHWAVSCTAPSALAAASPTAKGITLSVTDANDVNNYEFYVNTNSSAPGSSTPATHSVSSAKSLTITNLVAGTTYYAWARSKCGESNKSDWVALGSSTFTTSTVSADYHPTNVTKTAGATSGIGGSNFTATFSANTDYSLPSTITVTIDGNTATVDDDYTWADGTLTIPANKINGDIDITVNSAPAAPSSVEITGAYLFFPGETISLTATPTGGNGPTTYQWQKLINSVWTDITLLQNATAQSANFQIADATISNTGNYRCVVTKGGTESLASAQFDMKCLQLYTYYNDKSTDYGNWAFTRVDESHASLSVYFNLGGDYVFTFKVTDGLNNWYGNSGTMTGANHGPWTLNVNDACGVTVGKAATYVFNLDFSAGIGNSMTMEVDYPSADQAADKVIYFDNSVLTWSGSSIYYRIGHNTYNTNHQLTLVPGTTNLYQMTTTEFNGFAAWHIGNAAGQTGDGKSIYNTKNGTAITAATEFEGGAVSDAAVTVTPVSAGSYTGGDDQNNNCTFYKYGITTGMKTDNVAITAPTNGTITVAYTDTEDAAQSFTSGNRNLAHTCILTVSASPSTGYNLSALTINEVAHTSGNTHTLSSNATVAATFAAKQCTVVFDIEGGTGTITNVTATYGSAMPSKASNLPTKTGYTFAGFWDGDNGTGNQYYNADGTSAANWNKDTESNTTLYAKWNCITPDAPSAAKITATDGCAGSGGATFSADDSGKPSYVTWYWQTASDGTSTLYPVSSDYETASTAGSKTMYVRAKNTVCNTWSTATSKSATVKTAVTIAWNTAPADGTEGGSMTASVTTNYSDGVAYSVTSASPAGCVTINSSTGAISYVEEGTATIRATVTGAGNYCSSAYVEQSITVAAAPSLTALTAGTLYKVADMVPSTLTLTTTGQYDAGLSSNTKFEVLGDPSKTDQSGGTPEMKNIDNVTIDGTTFGAAMYLKRAAVLSSSLPTSHAVKFIVPGAGTLAMYVKRSDRLYLIKEGSSAVSLGSSSSNEKVEKEVTAGTYYIYANNTNTAVYGVKFYIPVPEVTAFSPATSSTVKTGTTVTITGTTGSTVYYMWGTATPPANAAAVVSGGTAGSSGAATVTTTGISSSNTYLYAVAVKDAVNSELATASYTIDDTAPTLSSSNPANGATDQTVSGTIVLTFSEAIASVDGSKFTLTGATKGAVAIDGSDATKVNIAYSGASNESTVTLATAAAAVSDAAGNASAALSNIAFTTIASSGCETIVDVAANSSTTVSATVGSATVNSPSSQAYAGAIKLNSSGYVELTPKAGSSFAAGDKITITMYTGADAAKTIGYRLADKSTGNSMSAEVAARTEKTFESTLVAADITDGKIKIYRYGSESWFVSAIVEKCGLLPDCTTPVIPSLSNQTVCPGSDIAAWDATQTAELADGETASYSWKKKGNDAELATTASFDLGSSASESQSGTYVVKVTVSADGKASASASAEVTLTVTPATEEPAVTQSPAKVYPSDDVTLTATCGSAGTITWAWYTCNSDGTGEVVIAGKTTATCAITAPAVAGTYYYKVKATGDGTNACGTAAHIHTLTVSAADACDKEFWFAKEGDRPVGAAAATHISGCPSGSSSASYTASIDGTNYTITGSTGQKTGNVTITVPADNTGTLYVVVQGSSSRTITLSKGGVQVGQETPANSTWGVFTFDDLDAGTYTLVSSGNISWGIVALKLCPTAACTDDTPTATATNATVCAGSTITITATGYEAGATFQWQKQNASTSAWENIAGATSATYSVATAAAEHAGNYHVVATKGCARTSNTVTIAVPSAPVFGAVPSSVSVMQTLALSITTVEASDAVKYRWYKSADATWDAGDAEICDTKNLLKAYDGEAVASPAYYVFCRAQNSCGITTSSAIAVNVTAYVAEDCAEKGNEGEAQFGFENTSCSQGTYSETSVWTSNSRSKYLTYTAPEGKYLKTAKVTVAVSSGSKCGYAYSTNSGSTWTYAELSSLSSTLTEKTIDLSGSNVTDFRISRNLQDGSSKDWGVTSGTFYLSKACFEYNEACTSTTVTPSTASTSYTIGGAWSNPTFSLTPAAVSGETLTYTSSNEDIATVDDDGTVNFSGEAGTVTITASYAGGTVAAVDYCASEGHYTITVSCSDEAPKIVPGGTVNMSGCNSSVTLNAKMQDGTSDFSPAGTYQWYRDGEAISGATSKSYTAVQAGIYTVERTGTGGCTNLSSNSATVTSETVEPEVEHLAPFQYYHVDKTYSAQMKMRHLFAVKNSKKVDGKSFKLYVSRNGGVATDVTSSNALAVWSNADGRVDTVMVDLNKLNGKYAEDDELVFTCKAIDCEDNVSDVYKDSITMHVIDQTPTLALILNGAGSVVGGDFLEDYEPKNLQEQTGSKTWSGEWPMYTDLKKAYNVTPVNGYAPFNKLNYEPFDIIFMTDFPKASKSDATKALLDDMYDLVDFRPMFSFKTHMLWVNPSKWAAKGFTAAPVVPKGGDGRTNMNIVCYAHPMFEEITTGEDVYRDNSDNSQLVYKMLTGTGYENSKGIQGFEIEAAENFVTIGLIHHNADATPNSPTTGKISWSANSGDRMLVAAAERQANLEARMIILSLNAGAHSKLTEKGRAVVMKSLEYLISDAADPLTPAADCSFTFDNAAGDGNWNTAGNWGPDHNVVPGQFTSVRIAAPVTVNVEHAHVMEARIVEGGSITIPDGKGLEVTSTIRHMDGAEISPTEISELTLEASTSSNGTLIFNNNTGDTKATVWAYSKGYIDHTDQAKEPKGVKNYQYIGTPFNAVNAAYNYYGSWIYYWKEDGSGWKSLKNGASMTAWTGYCITQETPTYYETSGTMTATGTVDIPVPADANMVVSNSWTAPIDINALTTDDLEGLTGNIYFFNTGVDKTGEGGAAGGDRYAGGTYVTVPVNSAPYSGDDHINSMQGFFVKNTGGSAGTLHLDYDRHVRGTTRGSIIGDALHAPARRAALNSNDPEVLKIKVSGENYDDKLLLLAREDFSTGFDNGWDGDKWDGNASALYLYTTDDEGTENSVSAVPEMEGTVIGFRAGEDDAAYTLHFEYLNGYETLYLFDTQLNTYTEIKTGATYRFFTSDKEKHARFIITRRIPQTETGIEDVESGKWKAEGARKLLIEDKMYIMINGLLYDATGKVVK